MNKHQLNKSLYNIAIFVLLVTAVVRVVCILQHLHTVQRDMRYSIIKIIERCPVKPKQNYMKLFIPKRHVLWSLNTCFVIYIERERWIWNCLTLLYLALHIVYFTVSLFSYKINNLWKLFHYFLYSVYLYSVSEVLYSVIRKS